MAGVGRSRRFTVLMAAALAVFVGWSIAWFIIATYVDRHVERAQIQLADNDIDLECAQRKVTGFPFRIELRCAHGTHVSAPTGVTKLDGVTIAALIYQPTRLIMELGGPLSVQSAFWEGLTADWSLARASARMDLEHAAMTRLDGEVLNLDVSYGDVPRATVSDLNVNLRQHPERQQDLQFSVRLADLKPHDAVLAERLPSANVRIEGVVQDGAMLTEMGGVPRFLAAGTNGIAVVLDGAVVEMDNAQIAVEADMLIDREGHLNGKVAIAIAGIEEGIPALSGAQGGDPVVDALIRAVSAAPSGTVAGVEGRTMELTLRRGQVLMGILPLPIRLPPLDLSGLQ